MTQLLTSLALLWISGLTASRIPDCRAHLFALIGQYQHASFTIDEEHILPTIPWDNVSRVAADSLQNRKQIARRYRDQIYGPATGRGWYALERASLNGVDVFIKTSFAFLKEGEPSIRALRDVEREIFWTTFLAKTGWGPPFYGALETYGHPSLVVRFAEGIHVTWESVLPKDAGVTKETIEKLRQFKQFVLEHHIVPNDLQIRLRPNGDFVVVDPEFFRFTDDTGHQENAGEGVDRLIQNLQRFCQNC